MAVDITALYCCLDDFCQVFKDWEPRLTRHGYSVRTLAEQFNAKPVEIKCLLRGELDAARARELTDEMLAAGLPL